MLCFAVDPFVAWRRQDADMIQLSVARQLIFERKGSSEAPVRKLELERFK